MESRTSEVFRGVWGSSGDDVFAVGENGLIVHYNGKVWQKMPTPTREPLRGIWGSGPENIFAIGDGGVILRYDGKKWRFSPGRFKK